MRCAFVFLLAGAVFAQDFDHARAEVDAQINAGDELRAKGDLDGAVAAYRRAVSICKKALEAEEGKAAEGEEAKAPEPAPTDDGTPEGRKRVIAYYVKLLDSPGDEVRYNAAAQLGEMRAVEARDALLKVFQKDKYQVARRAAAWSLGRLGKDGVPAIPALIREIGGESALLGNMCERALGSITKDALGEEVSMGFRADMSPAERLEVQKKWQDWLGKNRERLKLGPPGPPQVEKPAEPGKR
jgi:hypothetical protein